MSNGALEERHPGELILRGDLRAPEVPALLDSLPVTARHYEVDLGGIERIDSAGLALILEWQRRLASVGGSLVLRHPPDPLVRLAQISGVDKLLLGDDDQMGMTEQ